MFVATIPAVLYIDKVGRKPILAGGAFAMAFCHLLIAIIFAKDSTQWATQGAAGWAAGNFSVPFSIVPANSWFQLPLCGFSQWPSGRLGGQLHGYWLLKFGL